MYRSSRCGSEISEVDFRGEEKTRKMDKQTRWKKDNTKIQQTKTTESLMDKR